MKLTTMIPAAALAAMAACTTTSPEVGLHLSVNTTDHVAGTFSRDGVAVAFDFSKQPGRHAIVFETTDGQPLVSTTLEGVQQTTSILGGRLITAGIPNLPDPKIIGDASAAAELEARPEVELLESLAEELQVAGVDPSLITPEPPRVESLWGYDTICAGVNVGRNYLSAAGASPTYIYMRKNTTPSYKEGVACILPWSLTASIDCFGGTTNNYTYHRTKYWWGQAFTVEAGYWRPGMSYVPPCIDVRVSAYTWSPLY